VRGRFRPRATYLIDRVHEIEGGVERIEHVRGGHAGDRWCVGTTQGAHLGRVERAVHQVERLAAGRRGGSDIVEELELPIGPALNVRIGLSCTTHE